MISFSGHKLKKNTVPVNLFDGASFKDKQMICRIFLAEPLLRDNFISFDEDAQSDDIAVVEVQVVYQNYSLSPQNDTLIRCPIRIENTDSAYIYVSAVEQAEFENSGQYFLFSYHSKGKVSILMRSKLQSALTLDEIVNNVYRSARFLVKGLIGR